MTEQQQSLRGHLSDMQAATSHIVEALARQVADEEVKKDAKTLALVNRVHGVTQGQVKALEAEMARFEGGSTDAVKQALTSITGALAGLYDKVRPHPVSRMLRDDYTALSLAVVSNSMLHVTALAAGDSASAGLALRNMEQLAPLIIELGEGILPVVERELGQEFSAQPGAAQTALQNVRKVWSSPHANV